MMAGLFLKHLPPEASQRVHQPLLEDILSLNGKSSIFQMERCAQRLVENAGPSLKPEKMLQEYLAVLQAAVQERISTILAGKAQPDEFVVHGARRLLGLLQERGLTLIILSGTAEPQVKQEAALLQLASFFGPHIYGGTANLAQSSKQAVIERLLREEQIPGDHLLAVGDGPVELQIAKAHGGLAVGIASDEDLNGSGKPHPQKVPLLRQAGADLLIADYRQPDRLVQQIFGS